MRSASTLIAASAFIALLAGLNPRALAQPEAEPEQDDAKHVPPAEKLPPDSEELPPAGGDDATEIEGEGAPAPSSIDSRIDTEAETLPPRQLQLRPSPGPLADPVGPFQVPPLGSPTDYVHAGLFLRAGLGLGGLSVSRENVSYRGTSGSIEVSIGHSLIQNLLLFVELRAAVVNAPGFYVDGQEFPNTDVLGMATYGVGLGATHYLPFNTYASATLTTVWLEFEDFEDRRRSTRAGGFGFKAAVGKEWFASPQWGLGVAFQFHFARYPDQLLGGRWTGVEGTLAMSATYN
jgi:hypothetical protein